jgi:hypothetical protein
MACLPFSVKRRLTGVAPSIFASCKNYEPASQLLIGFRYHLLRGGLPLLKKWSAIVDTLRTNHYEEITKLASYMPQFAKAV